MVEWRAMAEEGVKGTTEPRGQLESCTPWRVSLNLDTGCSR